jgi:hypothetical protein
LHFHDSTLIHTSTQVCFFAHLDEELREADPDPLEDRGRKSPSPPASTCSAPSVKSFHSDPGRILHDESFAIARGGDMSAPVTPRGSADAGKSLSPPALASTWRQRPSPLQPQPLSALATTEQRARSAAPLLTPIADDTRSTPSSRSYDPPRTGRRSSTPPLVHTISLFPGQKNLFGTFDSSCHEANRHPSDINAPIRSPSRPR